MQLWRDELAFVDDALDSDAASDRLIHDDVTRLFKASPARACSREAAPNLGISGEQVECVRQFLEVSICLSLAPSVLRVRQDFC